MAKTTMHHAQALAAARRRIYLLLTVMTLVFLILNIIQIIFIYELNDPWWTAGVPAGVLVVFLACLGYYVLVHWNSVAEVQDVPKWPVRAFRLGIVLTVLLNIAACQFLYMNCIAIHAAREKTWKITMHAEPSLSPPAMALTQGTAFSARAVLASDPKLLEQLASTRATAKFTDEASFGNWSTFPDAALTSTGLDDPGNFSHVVFNATDRQLSPFDDLDLAYLFYHNVNTPSKNDPSLSFRAFDPKFLESEALFRKALDCGILTGQLIPVLARVQVALEQYLVNDEVKAVHYDASCDDISFRQYVSYRTSIVPYGAETYSGNCSISDTRPPPNQSDPLPCTSDVDIKFSSTLVTEQTSQYSRSRVEMLTDEGGIVGAVTFITWFLGILKE